jgi:hypothetical protein
MCKSGSDVEKVNLIANFFKDVKTTNITFDSVIDKYLCLGSAKDRKKNREVLTELLSSLRASLNKSADDFKNSIKPYTSLSNNEKNINMGSDDEKNCYYYTDGKGNKIFILIQNGRIASFSVLRKGEGGQGVFLVFCG